MDIIYIPIGIAVQVAMRFPCFRKKMEPIVIKYMMGGFNAKLT